MDRRFKYILSLIFFTLTMSFSKIKCMKFTQDCRFGKKVTCNKISILENNDSKESWSKSSKSQKFNDKNSFFTVSKKDLSKKGFNNVQKSKNYTPQKYDVTPKNDTKAKNNISQLLVTNLANQANNQLNLDIKPEKFTFNKMQLLDNDLDFNFPENSPGTPPEKTELITQFIKNTPNKFNESNNSSCSENNMPTPNNSPTKKESKKLLTIPKENYNKERNKFQKKNSLIKLGSQEDLLKEQAKKRKKYLKDQLKKINLDFQIITDKKTQNESEEKNNKNNTSTKNNKNIKNSEKTKNNKILNINGSSFFCDIRNFTCFSQECPKVEDPAKFMRDITQLAENVVTEWGGYIIGIAGDAHLGFFPNKKNEQSLKASVLNCFLCSIEFVIKSLELMKEKTEEYYPKQCDLGIEAGTISFYLLTKLNRVLKYAVTANTINLAQRYEDNAKKSTEKNTRKITLTEEKYNMLTVIKKIKKLFGPKRLLQAKGVKGRPFVYSCSLENIKKFYASDTWIFYKKEVLEKNAENKPVENLNELFKLFSEINKTIDT